MEFELPIIEYVKGLATLVIHCIIREALGVPTGPHGAFCDYQVDAMTTEISGQLSTSYKVQHNEFLIRGGRLVKGIIRFVNNLLEKFHQSFFLYRLRSPKKCLSWNIYDRFWVACCSPSFYCSFSLF